MVVVFVTGVKLTPVILLLPLPLLYTFLFASGIGLLISAYAVFFRDLQYLYEVLLTAWMYFTPLFYPMDIIPDTILFIFKANPLYHLLNMFRDIIMFGRVPSPEQHVLCLAIGLVSLGIGFLAFYKRQDRFILYI